MSESQTKSANKTVSLISNQSENAIGEVKNTNSAVDFKVPVLPSDNATKGKTQSKLEKSESESEDGETKKLK